MAVCEYSECPKHDNCERYLSQNNSSNTIMEFKNICTEDNNYQYLWNIKTNEE